MTEISVDIIGWVGVVLYIVAYVLLSMGRLGGRSRSYQVMNAAAAVGVAANAFFYGAYPSAVVNVIWFAIAAITLFSVVRRSR